MGERANNILDWERRHVAMCAANHNLRIVLIDASNGNETNVKKANKPQWSPLPGWVQEKDGYVWKQ